MKFKSVNPFELSLLVPAFAIFTILVITLNFIQDDAYISYRYVANYLNGDGLVFNIGERIEGFTNFGWVIYMIFWGTLGFNFILISKITGIIFGAGIIALTYLIAKEIFTEKYKWFAFVPVYIVAINQSLAYWSPAGLETAAFAFFAVWSLYLFLKQSRWLMFSILIAVWLRPEGAFIAGLLILIEAVINKSIPRYSLSCSLTALILSLPYVAFKIFYFGSIFPNPFYAKTGFDMTQLMNGFEYTARFFTHYGFWGVGIILPLILFNKLSRSERTLLLFGTIYTIYIVLVGGDVLKVHRFFIPLFPVNAILLIISFKLIIKKYNIKTQQMGLALISIPLLYFTFNLPDQFVKTYNNSERGFIRRMSELATNLKKSDNRNFSVALPTIGIFGYTLIGHDIIDMVGLTDSTIARHSEQPIEGMISTWKEGKHNSKYLLTRSPNYIVFSTIMKPSAPAEKALLLYPQFLENYRTVGWRYQADPTVDRGILNTVFKKVRENEGEIIPTYPVAFVENYKLGLDQYTKGDLRGAIQYFNKSVQLSPKPYYVYLIYMMGFCNMRLGQHEISEALANRVIEQDSLVFEAHKDLYMYATYKNDKNKAAIHETWLKKLVPWYLPRIKKETEHLIRQGLKLN